MSEKHYIDYKKVNNPSNVRAHFGVLPWFEAHVDNYESFIHSKGYRIDKNEYGLRFFREQKGIAVTIEPLEDFRLLDEALGLRLDVSVEIYLKPALSKLCRGNVPLIFIPIVPPKDLHPLSFFDYIEDSLKYVESNYDNNLVFPSLHR